MRARSRRRNLVVWSSSAGLAARRNTPACPRTTTRIRRRVRICALLALIGMTRLARAVRAPRLLLAGAVLIVAGVVLSAGLILIAGMLILLRGVAVTLGVSEPRRPDFYGFGTRPDPGSPGQNRT
jgi:hypothetical protein